MKMQYSKAVQIWLFVGTVMVFGQIFIGGVTRLTGSGLSITKWEIVTGTLPPMNAADWQSEFDLYKTTPQYKKINEGMSMKQFKFIYFWEYFHRLWARSMGFVFLFPFIFFWWKKDIDRPMTLRLLSLVCLAAIVAAFGWIMVASGLVDRPWVNAYKLTLHLNLGIALFGLVLWTYLYSRDPQRKRFGIGSTRSILWSIMCLLIAQLILGGVMSGMKAGLYYPTWPDMNGQLIPALLFDSENWTWASVRQYDTLGLMPALVQLLHRLVAYTLVAVVGYFIWSVSSLTAPTYVKRGIWAVGLLTGVQVALGILTVINCIGGIPVVLGVLHQAVAVLLTGSVLYTVWVTDKD